MRLDSSKKSFNLLEDEPLFNKDIASVDYDDEVPYAEYIDPSALKLNNKDNVNIMLDKIEKRLSRIEGMLSLLCKDSSSQGTSMNTTIYNNVKESLPSVDKGTADNMEVFRTPASLRPKGTMLEEIQTVLTPKDLGLSVGDPAASQQNNNDLNTDCSLDMSMYDDNV